MSAETTMMAPGAGPVIRWRSVAALWRRHLQALLRVWKVAITWFVVEPGIALLACALGIGGLVGDVDGGISYAAFVAPGIVVGTAMFHAIFEASWSAFERIDRSLYETFLTAPVTVPEIVLGEIAFASTRALISTLSVSAFAVGFGWIPFAALPGLLLVSVGVGAVFGCIGQLFAALAPSMHTLSLVFTLVATPMYFFSGSFFPVSVLPDALEPVARALPLTPLVDLARAFSLGTVSGTQGLQALYVVALVAVLLPLAMMAMRRRLLR